MYANLLIEEAGTTTAPIEKEMDLPPYGHVILVDTIGIDFTRELGPNRLEKPIEAISSADFLWLLNLTHARNYQPTKKYFTMHKK
ncbi:MAG: hypothetical protein MZV64_20630 [Ignavibacteriales bacterium]|nr:hypothetical protein [Ignavibacteriales bacterium]